MEVTDTKVLESKVLVLNKSYSPIRITTVRDAFTKIYSNAAEIISIDEGQFMNYDFNSWAEISEYKILLEEEYGNDWVHTPSLQLLAPRVIRMLGYEKAPRFKVRLSRKNIYTRDNHTCQYCGKKFGTEDLNIDHVIPKSRGGKNTWENLVCSCIKCNQKKDNKTPKEAGMKLLSKPKKPSAKMVTKGFPSKRYKEWDMFISDQYWNTELKD